MFHKNVNDTEILVFFYLANFVLQSQVHSYRFTIYNFLL